MSAEPRVACVMLTADRPEMTCRAIRSFRAQTYGGGLKLIIFDTTRKENLVEFPGEPNEVQVWHYHPRENKPCDETIGALRNKANSMCLDADIIAHFDSDDVSHPRRLEEQVALLQSSGKACVGYREAIFWDTRGNTAEEFYNGHDGAAWIYSDPDPRYMLGASMCYWRSAWEESPFDDAPHEDRRWQVKNNTKTLGVPAIEDSPRQAIIGRGEPRIICGIHGDNTSQAYRPEFMVAPEWRRAPEFDQIAAERMRL